MKVLWVHLLAWHVRVILSIDMQGLLDNKVGNIVVTCYALWQASTKRGVAK